MEIRYKNRGPSEDSNTLPFSMKGGLCLSWTTITFSRRPLFHGFS